MALDKILDYFISKEHRVSDKIVVFVTVISVILFFDYLLRFSDSYITESKLKQIEKIENLLSKQSLNNEVKNELVATEKEILYRKGFWETISSSCLTLVSVIKGSNSNNITLINTPKKDIIEIKPIVQRSFLWHTISSSYPFIIMGISFIFISLFSKNWDANSIVGVFVFTLIITGLILFSSYLFTLIPIIFENPFFNYILNAVLITIIVYLIWKYSSKKL